MTLFNTGILPKTPGAYLVGGSVRDLLIGKTPSDYDIAVLKNPEEYAKDIAMKAGGRIVQIGKPGKVIHRIVTKKHIFDIASINGTGIEDDLKQRDFTINAMAYCLSTDKIIDCLGGLNDLDAGCIRMVSPTIFFKDPIRLLRAYRMEALLDFTIEPETESVIERGADLIASAAGERIWNEYFKILSSPESYRYIHQMNRGGLLKEIFPELAGLKECTQNRHHLHNVFIHTLRTYHHLERMLNGSDQCIPDMLIQHIEKMNPQRSVLLKHAALLHDIGKPLTRTTDERGDIHFYQHEKKGADISYNISNRLKLSTRDKQFIDTIIRNHLQPLHLYTAHKKGALTPKGTVRFFNVYGDGIFDLLLHFIADTRGKGEPDARNVYLFTEHLLHQFMNEFKPVKSRPPLVSGDDLIHEMGLSPSPLFKTILDRVEEKRLLNKITLKTEAMAYIKKILSQK
ncbi:MAG: HD domain-containing protein [Desulfobacterales bacterium]|nr:HD domain-containing protein [Desulfobacterales bacterium]MDD4071722.1 HD domain-containing protein [Desulfobacterales bacterium]MDD4391684.1 HD domain-containing protein [Desulfobacterales bacterium]